MEKTNHRWWDLNVQPGSGLAAPGMVGASSPKSCSVLRATALPGAGRDAVFDRLLASLLCLPAEVLIRYFVFLASYQLSCENAPEMQTGRDGHL